MQQQSWGLMKQKLHSYPFVFHFNETTKHRLGLERQQSKECITSTEKPFVSPLITPHVAAECHRTKVFFFLLKCDEIVLNILP